MTARILVAHPNAAMRDVLRTRLEREGFEVQEAADATTTIAIALALRPEAIVLDGSRNSDAMHALTQLRSDFRTALIADSTTRRPCFWK